MGQKRSKPSSARDAFEERIREHVDFPAKMREYRAFLRDDFDWDWSYILRLLKYKLERTRKHIVGHRLVAGWQEIGREIREVEVLLDRVMKDRYLEEISEPHHKKYGRIRFFFRKDEKDPRCSRCISKFARETPENRAQARREWHALHRKAERMQEADLRRAFRLMEKKMMGWWD